MILPDAAAEYAEQGFAVFPTWGIVDGACECGRVDCSSPGKHPRTRNGSKDATRDVETVRAWWERWPNANIGLATGAAHYLFVIDIDRNEDKDGFLWLDAMQGELPSVPQAITPSGGAHLVFRYPEGRSVKQSSDQVCRGVDVRSDGGYIVVEPSVGVNGVGYMWEDDPREFAPPEAPAWLLDVVGHGVERARGVGPARWRVSNVLDEMKRAEIADALRYVEDVDSRDVWLKVGMAIHSYYANEQGFDLWCEWSGQSSKFDLRDQRKTWDRFDSYGDVKLETIFWLAKQNDWPGLTSAADPDEVVPWEPPAGAGPLPPELLDVPGLLGDMVRWIESTAPRPSPVLSLACSIAALGAVFGRRFEGVLGTRTNVYCLGVAPPGYGKENARQCVKVLFSKAGIPDLLGGEELASGPGIIKALTVHPTQLFLVDEIGDLMQNIAHHRASSWERQISSTLMKLESSAGTVMRGREVAHSARTDLIQPHACLYGTTTPRVFEALGSGAIAGGLMSRLLVFNVDGARGAIQEDRRSRMQPPGSLVAALGHAAHAGEGEGNLARLAVGEPEITVIGESPGCRDVWRRVEALESARITDRDGEMWARLGQQARRLALVRALGRTLGEEGTRVEASDAQWGADVATWCLRRASAAMSENVADTAAEAAVKAVLKVVRGAGRKGVSKSDLTRATWRLGKRSREEAIETLVESHKVIADVEGRRTKYLAVRRRG